MSERRIRNNRRKRQRELRRKGFFLLLSLILTFVIGITFFSFSTRASNSSKENSYKYYTSIILQDGDSLWSLAEENCDGHYQSKQAYINEIKKINGLSDDNLISGQYLVIPYYSVDFK